MNVDLFSKYLNDINKIIKHKILKYRNDNNLLTKK